MNSFYTADEAATYLTDIYGSKTSSRQILDLAKREQLPVCFEINDDLFNVTIQSPDGSIEEIKLDVPIDGVVKSLVPPKNKETLSATLVTVLVVNGMQFVHKDRVRVKGHQLPTEEIWGGLIKKDYVVRGLIDSAKVPSKDWLFSIDDLQAIIERKTADSAKAVTKPKKNESHITYLAKLKTNNPKATAKAIKKLCLDSLDSLDNLDSPFEKFNNDISLKRSMKNPSDKTFEAWITAANKLNKSSS